MLDPMKSTARQLDQFYTDPALAGRLVQGLRAWLGDRADQVRYLEPSAGKGAFLEQLPVGSLGWDLHPAHPDVSTADFLQTAPLTGRWVVVGNPPFGKNASLAIRFFNHAARFAEVIAFVVPRTFLKDSVQRRLDPHFHLDETWPVPEDAFEFEGAVVHVPCVFQIWSRRADARVSDNLPTTHPDFEWVPPTRAETEADFAFQRVGAKAGTIKDMGPLVRGLAPPSHHFIRVLDRTRVAEVRTRFENLDWQAHKHNVAGNPSISKREIVATYTAAAKPVIP